MPGWQRAYGGKRKISWVEIFAGDKARIHYATSFDENADTLREFVGHQGPLSARGGRRNALAQVRAAQKPRSAWAGRAFRSLRPGVSTPWRYARDPNGSSFREDTRDIYAASIHRFAAEQRKLYYYRMPQDTSSGTQTYRPGTHI